MDAYKAESITFRVKTVQRAMLLTKYFNNKNILQLNLALHIKKCYSIFLISCSGISKPIAISNVI